MSAARLRAMADAAVAARPTSYDEVEACDVPAALFAAAHPGARSGVRAIVADLEGRRVASLPLRCDAEWTKAPTLMAMSVAPLPPSRALAPLLEPSPSKVADLRRRTFAVEAAIFVATFLLVALPAAIAYVHWMR